MDSTQDNQHIPISPFDLLPSETLTTILQHTAADCGVHDLLALAATSHRLYKIYQIHQIFLLASAVDCTYGPLQDVINLVTYNSNQPVHVSHNVPISLTLLRSTISMGRVAKRWEELYPFKKWQGQDSIHRRMLTDTERRRLRRAVYHIWLYSKAFHIPAFPGFTRQRPEVVAKRTRLVQCWSVAELTEVMDMQRVFRKVLANNVCPSNKKIQRKVQQRYGDEYAMDLLFNTAGTTHPSGPLSHGFLPGVTHYQHQSPWHHGSRYMLSAHHDPALEGFGDDDSHYYKTNDMLKLTPQHILHLYENPGKAKVDAYVRAVASNTEINSTGEAALLTLFSEPLYHVMWPEWFDNNGETLGETIQRWLIEHGADFMQIEQDIDDGVLGVATSVESRQR